MHKAGGVAPHISLRKGYVENQPPTLAVLPSEYRKKLVANTVRLDKGGMKAIRLH